MAQKPKTRASDQVSFSLSNNMCQKSDNKIEERRCLAIIFQFFIKEECTVNRTDKSLLLVNFGIGVGEV